MGGITGRSSVWLERYLGVVEAARSSRVAPTKAISHLTDGFFAYILRFIVQSQYSIPASPEKERPHRTYIFIRKVVQVLWVNRLSGHLPSQRIHQPFCRLSGNQSYQKSSGHSSLPHANQLSLEN